MGRKRTPVEASVLTMTVDELASLIPCGRMQAYKAVKSGQFPSIRVGKTIKVLRRPALRILDGDFDRGPDRPRGPRHDGR
jgi:excisionase family DNA binding protein